MEFFKANFFEKRLDNKKMIRIFQGKDFVTLKSVIAKAIKRAKDI